MAFPNIVTGLSVSTKGNSLTTPIPTPSHVVSLTESANRYTQRVPYYLAVLLSLSRDTL